MRMHRRGRDPEKLRRCRQVSRQPRIKHAASDKRRRIPTASPVRPCHTFHTKASRVNECQQVPRQPQKSSVYVTMCHACHSIKSHNVTKTNRKHHSQPTSHMPRIPRAIKHRQDLSPSTTRAIHSDRRCHTEARLPRTRSAAS